MTIKITKSRAINVHKNFVALAAWVQNTHKDTKVEKPYIWSEYSWPSSMDRAINLLAQELLSDMDQTVNMTEFKSFFGDALNQIKTKINEV